MEIYDSQISSKDIYQDGNGAEVHKLWKVIRDEHGVSVVTHVAPARTFLKVFCVLFLAFTWWLILWVKGMKGLLFLVPGTVVGIMCCAFMVYVVTAFERAGNLVEPAGSRKIRLPRKNTTLDYDEIVAILLAQGEVRNAENRFTATQVLIQRKGDPSEVPPIPVITCVYREFSVEIAEALSSEIKVPIIECK